MIYKLTIYIVRFLIFILNGTTDYTGLERLPKDTSYVLVSPHRSWLDPVMLALAVYPQPLIFMAKKELFDHSIFGWFISKLGAFPVNREKPGPSAIKYPVSQLKENQKGLVIFPSGTRYSKEMKGGAVTIARLANVPIVPAVYQGPFSFKNILKRQKMHVRIGNPLYLSTTKLSKEEMANYDQALIQTFEQLDKEIDPHFND